MCNVLNRTSTNDLSDLNDLLIHDITEAKKCAVQERRKKNESQKKQKSSFKREKRWEIGNERTKQRNK